MRCSFLGWRLSQFRVEVQGGGREARTEGTEETYRRVGVGRIGEVGGAGEVGGRVKYRTSVLSRCFTKITP